MCINIYVDVFDGRDQKARSNCELGAARINFPYRNYPAANISPSLSLSLCLLFSRFRAHALHYTENLKSIKKKL